MFSWECIVSEQGFSWLGLSSSARSLRCVQRYRVRREETCIYKRFNNAFTMVHLYFYLLVPDLASGPDLENIGYLQKKTTMWYYDGFAPTCSLLDSPRERRDQECTFWRTSATDKVSDSSPQPKVNKRLPEYNSPIKCWSFPLPLEVADPQQVEAPQVFLNRNSEWQDFQVSRRRNTRRSGRGGVVSSSFQPLTSQLEAGRFASDQ